MHIPIVVASGSEDPEHVRAVYALNGNCFMRKPHDLTQFLRFVEMCYEFWKTWHVLRTFALYLRQPTRPTQAHTEIIRTAAYTASALLC